MLKRQLGNSQIDASVIGLGTWAIGGWMWGGTDEKESIAAIHAAIDHGIDLIDTAPAYGFGYSEMITGKAIKNRRHSVVLATKCGLIWDQAAGEFFFDTEDLTRADKPVKRKVYKYLHPDSIRRELERSLKNLETDFIDLYQTHWQDKTTPIEDTMAVLEALRDEGKIRAIGVSNASLEQIKKYGAIDTDQEKFSMLDRDLDRNGIIEYNQKNNIAILAYSPLALGLLTGKIQPDRQFSSDDLRRSNPRFTSQNISKVNAILEEFATIANQFDLTLAQLVIAWTYHQKGITHVLCGARNARQAIENAHSGIAKISLSDLNVIDSILQRKIPELTG